MNRRVFGIGIGIIAVIFALLFVGISRDKEEAERNKVLSQTEALETLAKSVIGQPAPDFELETLSGETVRLSDFKGQAIVLNFWATWCKPCAQEHPTLLEGARQFQPQGVVFLGLLYDDDVDKAKAYLQAAGSEYPSLLDVGGKVADAYGVTGVPETYFVSTHGIIVDKIAEPLLSPMALNRRVVAALQEPAPQQDDTELKIEGFEPPLSPPITDQSVILTRAQSIGEGLRCPVCRSQSVAESTSGAARAMMRQIEQLVRRGYTDEQVVDYFLLQHGDAVRLAPRTSGLGLIAWLGPLFALLAGSLILFGYLRRGVLSVEEDLGQDALTADLLSDVEDQKWKP